ncbi:MAG: AMP-binding protein, partial [Halioglobus sp.]|nr:AMP-binding protein [Halioglobus sp.]
MSQPTAGEPRLLHDVIARRARQQPHRVALWWRGAGITYAALQQRIQALAGRLAARGEPGERVAVLAWNRPEFIELIYAAAASGRILVPLNTRLAPPEWHYQLQRAGVSTLIGEPELLGALRRHTRLPGALEIIELGAHYGRWLTQQPPAPLPRGNSDDPVWILFTSGSTGRPKGAVLTHASILAGLRSAALGRPVLADDRYFYPFPLFHIAAHNVLLQHLFGAAVVLAERFDAAQTLRACRELGITTLSLAPTMLAMLLDCADFSSADLHTVRTIGYGASAMPQTLLLRLLRETSVNLCQGYGMTELSGSIAFLTPDDHALAVSGQPHLLQSVGRPLPGVDVRLVDDAGAACASGAA